MGFWFFFFLIRCLSVGSYQEDGQVDQLHLILLHGGKPTSHSGQYGLHGIWFWWKERAIVPELWLQVPEGGYKMLGTEACGQSQTAHFIVLSKQGEPEAGVGSQRMEPRRQCQGRRSNDAWVTMSCQGVIWASWRGFWVFLEACCESGSKAMKRSQEGVPSS